MTGGQRLSLLLLRVGTGFLMFYAGLTKIMNPEWSAVGYLENAKTFPEFFQWFLQPGILPITNLINEWGLTLLGASLILGVGVRLSSALGALLMLLYYFPVLDFPNIAPYYYIIDDHIIYALVLILLSVMRAGHVWGLDSLLKRNKLARWL
jgi:thiosulfate dehydrogenase [quinone] large subunit